MSKNNQFYDPGVVNANVRRHYTRLVARSSTLKARSTLRIEKDLNLNRAGMRAGFMGVMSGAYQQSQLSIFLGLALAAVSPELMQDNRAVYDLLGGKRAKLNKALMHAIYASMPSSAFIKIVRADNEFIVTVPIAQFSADTRATLQSLLFEAQTQVDSVDTLTVRPVNYKRAMDLAIFDATAKRTFSECLLSMDARQDGEDIQVTATFRVSKEGAQHMSNKKWVTIRPIDIFPIIRFWVDKYFGYTGKFPTRSFSVSSIARTLPTDTAVMSIKVNDEQLTCNATGSPLFIPKTCDNTVRFEDQLMQAGGIDGSTAAEFQLAEFGNNDGLKAALPKNMPVLTDWVNGKFAYSNTHGMLEVQNLEHCRVATSVHISTWLKRALSKKDFTRILNLAAVGTSGIKFQVKDADFDNGIPAQLRSAMSVQDYINKADSLMVEREQRHIQIGDLAHNSEFDYLRPIGKFLRDVHRDIMANLDSVFVKYSVTHTILTLPWIILAAVYAPRQGEVNAEAAAINAPAVNQKGSPDYQPPATTMWNGDLGLQPHQRRAAEKLSTSAAFAILPIPAGGGKTPVIIFDILQNLQKGVGNPYLILCPSHLVAQYVKEINFFTSGRLNCIPIITRVYKNNGVARLTQIIKNAPRNTVVVADYGALSLWGYSVCYGTENVNVYPVAELLKQFSFGYCALDESHYVKNEKSARTRAAMGLIADIPMKRLASGTMAHDSPSDLAAQVSMLDPTIFGSKEDFNEEFGLDIRGSRVISWKPGYAVDINKRISERVVVAGAHRKEWAALLPPIDEFIEPVDMSENQKIVYDAILSSELEKIKANADLMKQLDANQSEDPDDEETDLAALLGPHLSRLESFVSAPDKDEMGIQLLSGDDLVSPKMAPINQFIKEHIDQGRNGKILIFTNHVAVAEHIYEHLLPRFQKMAIHYLAAEKVEAATAFEKDDNKRILVGAEHSLNTGLNLQQASMLIRVEQVWNPGTLEQGNSRINRPSLKVEDKRDAIYYRWIVCNRSIDVTKMSRLTAKIVTVAKYENPTNPQYQQLEDVEVIPLNLDTIATENSWDGTLRAYGNAYRNYRQIVLGEYAEFKEKFIEKYGKDFMFYPGDAGNPEDAALAAGVPWVPGLEVLGESELDLIRVDQFIRLDDEANNSLEEDEGEDTVDAENQWQESVKEKLIGQKAFCEYGEGIIRKIAFGMRRLTIAVDNMEYRLLPFNAAFIQGRPLKAPIRKNQSKLAGMSVVEIADEMPVRAAKVLRVTKTELRRAARLEKQQVTKKRKAVEDMQITVQLVNTNGFLGLRIDSDEHSSDVIDALAAQGFRPDLPTYRARMKTYRMLDQQMILWNDKKFMVSPELEGTKDALVQMYEMLKSKKVDREKLTWTLVNRNKLRNFYRMELKPSTDKKALKMYPVMEDGMAYIYLSMRGQAGSRPAMRYKAPGVIWQKSPDTFSWYCVNPSQMKKMLESLVKSGIKIRNKAQVQEQYSNLRKAPKRKGATSLDVDIVK